MFAGRKRPAVRHTPKLVGDAEEPRNLVLRPSNSTMHHAYEGRRLRAVVLSADIVGPTRPLSFAGATVHDAFALINLLGNVPLGVGALSYAGHFRCSPWQTPTSICRPRYLRRRC